MADEADPVEGVDDVQALRREAASRRKALRTAEAENETLRTRPDQAHRNEVERLAADRLQNPSDLLLAVTLDDLRGEDGVLDPQRATAAIDRVLAERPHWAIPAPAPPEPTRLDVHGGAREPPPPPPLSFGQAIRDSRLTG